MNELSVAASLVGVDVALERKVVAKKKSTWLLKLEEPKSLKSSICVFVDL